VYVLDPETRNPERSSPAWKGEAGTRERRFRMLDIDYELDQSAPELA
jgi:hypothetical protein